MFNILNLEREIIKMKKEEAVASYFISLGLGENEDYMTNLRLNKLMYFTQAWSLVLHDKPLFREAIEAWQLGPVIPSVYRKYRTCGKNPIVEVDPSFSLDMLSYDEQQLLFAVMARYGEYSTHGLVDITHKPGSPWDQAFSHGIQTIQVEDIKAFFSKEKPLKLFGTGDDFPSVGYRNDSGTYVLPTDWE